MRNVTAATGDSNLRALTAATAFVLSSGSTFGHTSAVEGRLYLYLIDNVGTLELAVSSKFFGVMGLVSTTAEGGAGAADSATVMYSTVARANVPFRLIAMTRDTQTVAGTWTAVPTMVNVGQQTPFENDDSTGNSATSTSATTAGTVTAAAQPAVTSVGPSLTWGTGTANFGTITKRKTADESIASSTVLQDDDHLTFAIAANEEWVAEYYISVGSALSTTSLKIAIATPSGATQLLTVALETSDTTASVNGRSDFTNSSGTDALNAGPSAFTPAQSCSARAGLWVLNGATPGNVTLQWAQQTSSVTALTFRKGSYMKATRIA
jgi:hypothetical protein